MTFDSNYITSGMIYGTLWDVMAQWLSKSGYNVGYTGKTTSGYGNYKDEIVNVRNENTQIIIKPAGIAQILETGQTSYTKINNIYDISGNCSDWTQEGLYIYDRVKRRRTC